MKRKITECTKPRRCIRRHKLPELSVFFHIFKLFFGWAVVMFFDCILNTRLEYLWPLYICAHEISVYLEVQGLGCCSVFVFSYILMDTAFFYIIPMELLYLIASIYIWVCYTSIAEKGCSHLTIGFFLAVVSYIELCVRPRSEQSSSYETLISKPLASHSVSVALSSFCNFAVKRFADIINRLRTQYCNVIQTKPSGNFGRLYIDSATSRISYFNEKNKEKMPNAAYNFESYISNKSCQKGYWENIDLFDNADSIYDNTISAEIKEACDRMSVNEYVENNIEKDCNKSIKNCGVPLKSNTFKLTNNGNSNQNIVNTPKERKNKTNKDSNEPSSPNTHKDNYYKRLDTQLKKTKLDLQLSQELEINLRNQINSLSQESRNTKNELLKVQRHNDELQSKLHNLVSARQSDKQTTAALRKELAEEKKQKSIFETQCTSLKNELKKKNLQIVPSPSPSKKECTEKCKMRRHHLELKSKCLKTELECIEKRYKSTREEVLELYQYKEKQRDMEGLVGTISEMRERTSLLEGSLSAETRLKLDLFSALGEVKRQLDIRDSIVRNQEKEIQYLKHRLLDYRYVDACAVVPPFSSRFDFDLKDNLVSSLLDPNAVVYTPEETKSQ